MKKNKVYIGWDSRETLAYDVAKYSIISNTKNKNKLEIIPLKLENIKNIFNRKIEWRGNQMWCPISDAPQTTEFSLSRFCIPFLSDGWVLFIDCDVVVLSDLNTIFEMVDDKYAVMVVKHQQKVKENEIKMVNQSSVYYNRKNWSSVMLINCNHPSNKKLSLTDINNLPGRDLHAFYWLEDNEIGELDNKWNHLVDVNDSNLKNDASILHYTLGGPWIDGWVQRQSDDEWVKMYEKFKNQ